MGESSVMYTMQNFVRFNHVSSVYDAVVVVLTGDDDDWLWWW